MEKFDFFNKLSNTSTRITFDEFKKIFYHKNRNKKSDVHSHTTRISETSNEEVK